MRGGARELLALAGRANLGDDDEGPLDEGELDGDVYRNAVLFTRGGKIEAVVGAGEAVIPQDAMILDAEGGTYTRCTVSCR